MMFNIRNATATLTLLVDDGMVTTLTRRISPIEWGELVTEFEDETPFEERPRVREERLKWEAKQKENWSPPMVIKLEQKPEQPAKRPVQPDTKDVIIGLLVGVIFSVIALACIYVSTNG